MEQSLVEKLTKAITWAAVILAVAIVYSALVTRPKVGRYTFLNDRQNWVLVGDTITGKSWSCLNKKIYDENFDEIIRGESSDFPKGFEGCFEMSVPSKVQRQVSYEKNN